MAGDLRLVGIKHPQELIGKDPYKLYNELCKLTGKKHDPCVIDVFLSVVAYMEGDDTKPWWEFTVGRKNMIENYSFGSMTISEKQYTSDLKIINGQVYPDWRRKTGHSITVDEVADILSAKPDYLIIGSGKFGLMKVSHELKVSGN